MIFYFKNHKPQHPPQWIHHQSHSLLGLKNPRRDMVRGGDPHFLLGVSGWGGLRRRGQSMGYRGIIQCGKSKDKSGTETNTPRNKNWALALVSAIEYLPHGYQADAPPKVSFTLFVVGEISCWNCSHYSAKKMGTQGLMWRQIRTLNENWAAHGD